MKLLRAHFKNFRLLKDVRIEFSTDPKKKITVIRAANNSGKTTMLTALQWGLFGDEALPNGGKHYRLHPTDTATVAGTKVEVSVEIEYEVVSRSGPQTYRISRSVVEEVSGNEWIRRNPVVLLYQQTRAGSNEIDNPDAHLRPLLPSELREIFFTDGDRALTFIEGARGEQMKKVEGAIRSLLGLGIVEEAILHVKQASGRINAKVRDAGGQKDELDKLAARIAAIDLELPEKVSQKENAHREKLRLEDFEREADKALSAALSKGNKDELAKALEDVQKDWSRADKDVKQASRDHSGLFKSHLLAKSLLEARLVSAKSILDGLHRKGDIPNKAIPIFEERLNQPSCICGESLLESDPHGQKRRDHIKHLIEASRSSDALKERVSELYYSSQNLFGPGAAKEWKGQYSEIFERRQRANQRLQESGEKERDIEARIAKLPDVDIQQLRESRDRYRQQAQDAHTKETRLQRDIENLTSELKEKSELRGKLLNTDEKGRKLLSELQVASDVQEVLNNALYSMKTTELKSVSNKMNALFLEMIGAEDEQRAIIQKAEITEEFRIIVHGQNGRLLDPSQDLNGASRRALTISFILALTTVSEVVAPNVIDTPLGMTTGYVKRAIIRRAADESSQLILFLTHDEILGCENILDELAGKIQTMTNPTLYPKVIRNNPGTTEARAMICGCDHRGQCRICELSEDREQVRASA